MSKQQLAQPIKRALGLILLLIYLFGCTQISSQRNVSLESTSATGSPYTVSPITQETPSAVAATLELKTPPAVSATVSATPMPTIAATALSLNGTLGTCQLDRVTQPAWPVETLHPNELDNETGLHMTGRAQLIDLATYRLKVSGLVDHPLNLTYDDLRCLPNVTQSPELICPGVFIDRATWTGVPIKLILELAGIQQEATEVTLVSADGYEVRIPIETAIAEENFLAYKVNGEPLPVQHGFPLRAVFPSMWGSYWLKWLVEIRIS